jgi:hypothetical protein
VDSSFYKIVDESRFKEYCNQVPCTIGRPGAKPAESAAEPHKLIIPGASKTVSRNHFKIEWSPVDGLYHGTLLGGADIVVNGQCSF